MLIWLLDRFAFASETTALAVRFGLALATSLLASLVLGPLAIRKLKESFTERIASDSEQLNELHKDKNRTPTMGGLIILAAMSISTLCWCDLRNSFVWLGVLTAFAFGTLGAMDDLTKLRTERNGLGAMQKFLAQLVIASLVGLGLSTSLKSVPDGLSLVCPWCGSIASLGIGFVFWAMVVTVSTSNAVNLTDGLDGLATGCAIVTCAVLAWLASLAGIETRAAEFGSPYIPGSGEIAILLGVLLGALIGFLWFNRYPARIFMGDTGSLPIGALLAFSALVTKQELLLAVIGGVFVIETLSVILQVGSFKLTGKRIIRCSPLHNHFLFAGHSETTIVKGFWLAALVFATSALASLKIG